VGGWGDPFVRHEGEVVFAPYLIGGEEAVVRIRERRRGYPTAEVESILRASPHRVEPRCPLFGRCSGCQWQHIEYKHQLELKRRVVSHQLERVPVVPDSPVAPTLGSADPWEYRNHGRFTVDEGRLGFVRRDDRRFIEVARCDIMHPRINDVMERLSRHRVESTQCNIRVGVRSEGLLVQPRLPPGFGVDSGQRHYEEIIFDRRLRISAASFFQVNIPQAERLIDVVTKRLQPREDLVVLDTYAGVGTFATVLAPLVHKVIAVEVSGPALRDARINAEGVTNIEVVEGAAERVLAGLDAQPGAVILDPPRAGCRRPVIRALRAARPARIVYVSCNPATLGRDLGRLCDPLREGAAYRVEHVQPIDMFPHTRHVEAVATLRLAAA
jgi:23S rRNA (uracil1939-C5)-methyltransferase